MTGRISLKVAAVVLGSLGLTGCITDNPDLVTLRNQQSWSQTVHYITYMPGQSRLSASENAKLNGFLRRTSTQQGGTVVVMVSEKDELLGIDVAKKRAQSLIDTLARRGVRVRYVARVPGKRLRDKAAVSVSRVVAVPPQCNDWDRIKLGGDMIGTRNDFGCVVDSALHAQIKRKQDLVRGRPLSPANATRSVKTIDDYNTGKLPPVAFPKPSAPNSTTSGVN